MVLTRLQKEAGLTSPLATSETTTQVASAPLAPSVPLADASTTHPLHPTSRSSPASPFVTALSTMATAEPSRTSHTTTTPTDENSIDAASSGTNHLTENTQTPITPSARGIPGTMSTASDERTDDLQVTKSHRSLASKKSKAKSRKTRIMEAEIEFLRISKKLAAAVLKRLQDESDLDSEVDTVIDGPENTARVNDWVMETTVVQANENDAAVLLQPASPSGLPQAESSAPPSEEQKQKKSGAQLAPFASPVAVPTNAESTVRGLPATTGANGPMLNEHSAPTNSKPGFHNVSRYPVNSEQNNSANNGSRYNPVGTTGAPVESLYSHSGLQNNIAAQLGAPAPAGVRAEQQPRTELTELVSLLTQSINAGTQSNNRRLIELPIYSGAYQEWLAFKAAYNETAAAYTETENVARLRRCLKGKAKESVDSLLINNVKAQDIMQGLEVRFGRQDVIAIAELERLRALSRPNDSPRELCIFASRVANIVATLRALQREHYLYNPEVTRQMIEKLPSALKYDWYSYASTQSPHEPELVKLSHFLNIKADMCSPYAQPETDRCIGTSGSGKNNKNRTFTVRNDNHNSIDNKLTVKFTCPICEVNSHTVAECRKFINSKNNDRWDLAKKHRLCFRCLKVKSKNHTCKQTKCEEDGCRYWHHKLLHFRRQEAENIDTEKEAVASTWAPSNKRTFLKIIPVTASGPEGEVKTYALLDDGSTITLVDEDVAAVIGAKGSQDPLSIEAIADTTLQEIKSKRVTLTLRGAETHEIQARTIQGLKLSPQTASYEDIRGCEHLKYIEKYIVHTNAKPRILIGQDNWHLLVANTMKTGGASQPVASLTPLGWVLHGSRTRTLGQQVHYVNLLCAENNMEEELRRYFSIESLMIVPKRTQSDPEEQALKILKAKTQQRSDGYYETALLWKDEKTDMPNNYQNALTRLICTEKKIDKNELMKAKYEQQMKHLIYKGYAEKAPTATGNRTWYLPHFAIVNPMKPDKFRVVHDAAAKTKGTSLNDKLLTGPDLLQSLPGVLMRFRQHSIAVSADIAEMFMQVKITESDRDALRYLWRGNRRGDTQPTEYRMTLLIFGATSSPATAIFVKNLNASKHEKEYPKAAVAIVKNHYMDDYLQSFRSIEEAIKTSREVRKIHAVANFNLRQWTSNSTEVLEALEPGQLQITRPLDDGTKTERTLGLIWKPESDELAFNLDMARLPQNVLQKGNPTKREMLKIVMSPFDPLGFASPVITRAKQILQEVWRRGTGWDDSIPADLTSQWMEWMGHLEKLRQVRIPRCYSNYSNASKLELHTFVDASEAAYAAVLYWRVVLHDGSSKTSLIVAKARVAPLKVLSIPRLELQAAVMGSRMAEAVIEEHNRKPDEKIFWTDSWTVLTWLKTGARSYKPFVAHRIAAIEENSSLKEWRWVPTKLNVADDATREVPRDFDCRHRWFCGPEFLKEDPSTWPTDLPASVQTTGEERVQAAKHFDKPMSLASVLPDPERFSKLEKLVRATARILQFIEKLRMKTERVDFTKTQKKKLIVLPTSRPSSTTGDTASGVTERREDVPNGLVLAIERS